MDRNFFFRDSTLGRVSLPILWLIRNDLITIGDVNDCQVDNNRFMFPHKPNSLMEILTYMRVEHVKIYQPLCIHTIPYISQMTTHTT